MKSILKIGTLCLLLVMCGFHTSCTVGYSFTGADIPAEAKTFSIKTFQSVTPNSAPNYELRLTESLKDLMLAQTRLDLAEKKGDLQYEGIVVKYESSNAAVSGEEFTTNNRLTIVVKVKYANTFDREKNFEKTFSRFADYDSSLDFSTVEDELVEEINRQLTQDIFDASLGAW